MTDSLLTVEDLRTHLHTEDGIVKAVDGLDFTVESGETVCLVGESGSGKTLTCDTITGLVGPPAEISGSIQFDGRELLSLSEREYRSIRGNRISYVFQNAQSALDPVYTIGDQIMEAITFHRDLDSNAAREQAIELLDTVGLSRPAERLEQYPHELSEGMCQRVAIAIGLGGDPDLLIADEPTSALDVMIQARIIDLLDDLRRERDLAMLLVTHDLRVAATLADRMVVLYGGTGVERGPAATVFEQPSHPYTQELLRSFTGDGDWSSATEEPPDYGCRFHRECPLALEECQDARPPFEPIGGNEDHLSACVYHGEGYDETEVFERIPETVMGEVGFEPVKTTPEEKELSGGESNE